MKLDLPKIYPITDAVVSGLSHPEQVRRLIAGGANFIQVRDKVTSSGEFYTEALEVIRIARDSNVRIIINDRVDIALAVCADGVHLGQHDIPPASARALLGPNAIIGFSTHSIDQAEAAIREPVDYIALGPIFATSTKTDPEPAVGVRMISQVRDVIGSFPLVCIGGIRRDNAASVLDAGADSVAMIGDIVSDPERITEHVAHLLRVTTLAD